MNSVYEQTVTILQDYLGPAADRFLTRQIDFHLKKKPAQLTKSDLPKLVEWVKVSIALLTDDKAMVDECATRIEAITTER